MNTPVTDHLRRALAGLDTHGPAHTMLPADLFDHYVAEQRAMDEEQERAGLHRIAHSLPGGTIQRWPEPDVVVVSDGREVLRLPARSLP